MRLDSVQDLAVGEVGAQKAHVPSVGLEEVGDHVAADLVQLAGHARDHGGAPGRLGDLETGIELGHYVLGDGRRHVLLAHGDLLSGPHAADLVLCRREDVQVDLRDALTRVQRLLGESQGSPAVAAHRRSGA